MASPNESDHVEQEAPQQSIAEIHAQETAAAAPAQPETTPVPSAQPEASGATPAAPSFLAALRERGIDLGNDVADDAGALARIQRMHQEYQQLQPIAPYAQQYVQNYDQFNEYLKSKQAPKPEPEKKPFYAGYWTPPEYNPSWEKLITKDERGNLVPVPGAPPNIVQKFQEYQSYRQQQMEQFTQNPHEYMRPTVEHLAAEIAQREIQKHLGQYKEQQSVSAFLDQNQTWLFKQNEQGQPVLEAQFNPNTGMYENRKSLSEWGQMFNQAVHEEARRQEQRGYQDVEEQKRYAIKEVQFQSALRQLSEFMKGQQPGTAAATPAAAAVNPREAANKDFEARAVPRTRPTRNVSEPPQPLKSLREELQDAFEANGVQYQK